MLSNQSSLCPPYSSNLKGKHLDGIANHPFKQKYNHQASGDTMPFNFKHYLAASFAMFIAIQTAYGADVLQTVRFDSSEYFPEGGEFQAIKQKSQCSIKGTIYAESSQGEYAFDFKDSHVIKATEISLIYEAPIYIDNNPKIAKKIKKSYHQDSDKNADMLEIFELIYDQLSQKTLLACQ